MSKQSRNRKPRNSRVIKVHSAAWLTEVVDLEIEGVAPDRLMVICYDANGKQWPLNPGRDFYGSDHFRPGVAGKLAWKCECDREDCSDWWEWTPGAGGSLRDAIDRSRRQDGPAIPGLSVGQVSAEMAESSTTKQERQEQEAARQAAAQGSMASVKQVTAEDLAKLGPGYDVFDLMRDSCPHCQGH